MTTTSPAEITPSGAEQARAASLGGADDGFGAMWENAAIGLFRSAPDGRWFRANPALLRIAGYGSEAELQAALRDPDTGWYAEPGRWAEIRRRVHEQGPVVNLRSRIRRAGTGEAIWVSESAWVVRDADGHPRSIDGTVTDVSDEESVTESLRRDVERFRDFIDTAADWHWETGADHHFTYVSDRIGAFGIDPAAPIGRFRIDFAADPTDPVWREHRAALDRHEPFRDFIYPLRDGRGGMLHLSVSGKPVFDPEGRFLGYRGSARQITEQIQAREQLRDAWRRAEEASRAKSEFLANMSHELRTPLNAIIGFAEVMRDGLVPVDKFALYARYIHDSGQHLLDLINDILDMSKIVAGRLDLELEPVDAVELIRRTTAMFELRAEQGSVTLTSGVAPGLPPLYGDRVRLGQILVNLISNAVKFTDPGGRVDVRCGRLDDSRAVIEVADTGIGMSPKELATAMEPFGQVKRGGEGRRHEGTGLGLPIVRSLVELHGGRLTVDTERGRGTTVRLLLPLAASA